MYCRYITYSKHKTGSNCTVRPKGWEKATQIPPQISVKFQPFLVIFHYFCGGINELITLVWYVIFNFKYK